LITILKLHVPLLRKDSQNVVGQPENCIHLQLDLGRILLFVNSVFLSAFLPPTLVIPVARKPLKFVSSTLSNIKPLSPSALHCGNEMADCDVDVVVFMMRFLSSVKQ
jgi:hypothetical protein